MNEREFQKQAMSTALDLLKDEVDGKTWIGDELFLSHDSGDLWDVYKERSKQKRIRIDTIQPKRFGSGQLLATYLIVLSERNADTPDLPRTPTHSGNLMR